LIADTLIILNMSVLTRNTKDFAAFPVFSLNPFDYKA
jgi:predicted nucleic acid-binding protein